MGKKKKGKGKKGKESKYLDLNDGPQNHNGFKKHGEPLKIYTCERERRKKPGPDDPAPEDAEALMPCKTLRAGEILFSHVSELKQRVMELTGVARECQHLFFRASADKGGRPIKELRGWRPSWPWPADLMIIEIHDELPLDAYGVGFKTEERHKKEKAVADAEQALIDNDPKYAKAAMLKKEKEIQERNDAGKKKKSKGKKSAGKPNKDELKAMKREEAKKAKAEAEKLAKDDWHRDWVHNHIYMINKPAGMAPLNCFNVHPCQQTDADRAIIARQQGFPKPPGVMPKAQQNTKVTIISREDYKDPEKRSKLLPPIRGTIFSPSITRSGVIMESVTDEVNAITEELTQTAIEAEAL